MVGQYGAEADKAVRYFATTIAQQDPATALDWIATIEDPAERLKAADRVGREFGERMTERVESWIDSSKLGDAERAVVLEASNRTQF